MQAAIDRAARFGHSLEHLAAPSGEKPVQRVLTGESDDLWATQIAGRVSEESDPEIVKKIHLLHSLPGRFQVTSYESLVERIRAGEFDSLVQKSLPMLGGSLEELPPERFKFDTPPSELYRATGGSPEELMESRKSAADVVGLSDISFQKADSVNLDNWYGDHQELAGSHHKFPKRTLGWLHEHMSPDQRGRMKEKLSLDPNSGPAALARLRSNLIPWGPNQVASDTRRDDPEHTGESLDLVTTESGQLSPRSRSYMNLAFSYRNIEERVRGQENQTMTDEEAEDVASHLHAAEVAHYAIEQNPKQPADYGPDFWKSAPDGEGRQWIKGAAPSAKYSGVQPDPEAYDAAKQQEKQQAALARQREIEEQEARRRTPHYGAYAYLPKSARFW